MLFAPKFTPNREGLQVDKGVSFRNDPGTTGSAFLIIHHNPDYEKGLGGIQRRKRWTKKNKTY